ncbi:hypothetical protein [Thermorudis peleae]|mgnify:FL=1|uniref:hypothetical protein n=1 Tax=Thermorudis peleae TaxID=1382356 RepID=UPI00056DF9A3|nr:hypothetical protein [Thermorudis peleae]MBX6752964.1 hypothetical protein [Thermorudis peleae]
MNRLFLLWIGLLVAGGISAVVFLHSALVILSGGATPRTLLLGGVALLIIAAALLVWRQAVEAVDRQLGEGGSHGHD